ncbi:MAG: hypothetical protein CL897_01015 [Dehalococcoidia bacterium]|nr:hypothetical protein [Dehalococcoidia bacterium]HCV00659.1 hypothetical protein [Dehalococcoidia bacterium]
MTKKHKLLAGSIGIVTLIAITIFLTWWFLFRQETPAPVNLQNAISYVQDEKASTPTAQAGTSTNPGGAAQNDISGSEGSWTLKKGLESFVGYRVEEELATIGYKEAVGRSPSIEATITISDGMLTSVLVTADVRDLKSDDPRRDRALRQQALESNTFPTAKFVLTEPIAIPGGLAHGEPVDLTAKGTLTLHGVTKSITITINAVLEDDTLVVVGFCPILFSDYNIAQPRSPILVSIEDNGIMELQLFLKRIP